MKAYSSHDTALEYWRFHFPLDAKLGMPAKTDPAQTCAYLKKDVLSCIPELFRIDGAPIDTLVFDSRFRSWSHQVSCHVWSTPLPENAFYRVHDMYVSSPEFVFLQMAGEISTVQLVALGCELCGTYVLCPREKRPFNIPDTPPLRLHSLTSIQKIGSFLDAAEGARHLVKARRALRYVVEGSRSPMDTAVMLQLCLPAMLGGYGIPRPVFNLEIPLDDEARFIANRSSCEGDLCWEGFRLDVEYSAGSHAGIAKMREDATRMLGIEHAGWKVVAVTGSQTFDIDQFEAIAKAVAKHVGHRLHKRVLGHTPARLTLHDELAEWMGIGFEAAPLAAAR